MLTVTVPGTTSFNNETSMFVTTDDVVLELEHSLVSLSKWESKYEKAFLGPQQKTTDETYGYIEAMCLTPVSPDLIRKIPNDEFKRINDYIEAKSTATWFSNNDTKSPSREIVTAELIYYWMNAFNIDKEFENWHLNRLFTLIRVLNEKNKPQKKMSRAELAQRNRELNAQRKAQMKTNG